MSTVNLLVFPSTDTSVCGYHQALKATEKIRTTFTPEDRQEAMNLLRQKSDLSPSLSDSTNSLFTAILTLAKIEQRLSKLTEAEMEEYAIALLLIKLNTEEL